MMTTAPRAATRAWLPENLQAEPSIALVQARVGSPGSPRPGADDAPEPEGGTPWA